MLDVIVHTIWAFDPFPMLIAMASDGASVIVQWDFPIANAGLMYATARVPGGAGYGTALLEELAWRIKLFQRAPEAVGLVVAFAKPPYYANGDDQTLLNDCIVSFALRNRTFLGSTARFEARSKHNPNATQRWTTLTGSRELKEQVIP